MGVISIPPEFYALLQILMQSRLLIKKNIVVEMKAIATIKLPIKALCSLSYMGELERLCRSLKNMLTANKVTIIIILPVANIIQSMSCYKV